MDYKMDDNDNILDVSSVSPVLTLCTSIFLLLRFFLFVLSDWNVKYVPADVIWVLKKMLNCFCCSFVEWKIECPKYMYLLSNC